MGSRVLLASGGEGPGLLLNTPQGTGRPLAENDPAPNVTSVQVEKPHSAQTQETHSHKCVFLLISTKRVKVFPCYLFYIRGCICTSPGASSAPLRLSGSHRQWLRR